MGKLCCVCRILLVPVWIQFFVCWSGTVHAVSATSSQFTILWPNYWVVLVWLESEMQAALIATPYPWLKPTTAYCNVYSTPLLFKPLIILIFLDVFPAIWLNEGTFLLDIYKNQRTVFRAQEFLDSLPPSPPPIHCKDRMSHNQALDICNAIIKRRAGWKKWIGSICLPFLVIPEGVAMMVEEVLSLHRHPDACFMFKIPIHCK